jgi:hypothetical protein
MRGDLVSLYGNNNTKTPLINPEFIEGFWLVLALDYQRTNKIV